MRELLPLLLALSANSPFLDHRDTGLHSVRTEIFTRVFPRCGVHEPFGDWGTYAGFVDTLARTRSIVEATQLWWSVRPHHSFGTVEVRICDAQTRGDELELAAMMLACVAQTALDIDERGHAAAGLGSCAGGDRGEPLARDPLGARRRDDRLPARPGDPDAWSSRRSRSGPSPRGGSSASRWRSRRPTAPSARALRSPRGRPIEEYYRHSIAETRETYAPSLAAVVDD